MYDDFVESQIYLTWCTHTQHLRLTCLNTDWVSLTRQHCVILSDLTRNTENLPLPMIFAYLYAHTRTLVHAMYMSIALSFNRYLVSLFFFAAVPSRLLQSPWTKRHCSYLILLPLVYTGNFSLLFLLVYIWCNYIVVSSTKCLDRLCCRFS